LTRGKNDLSRDHMKKANGSQVNRSGNLASVFVCFAENDQNFIHYLNEKLQAASRGITL
jgi:hypothetical protein